jgi:predicted enzyme related to lactoylglutathione lyase
VEETRRRTGFPAGVPAWVDVAAPDPERATAFYGGLFGWGFDDRTPPDFDGRYLVATLDGREVAAVRAGDAIAAAPAWSTYIGVDDADESLARVRDAGGRAVAPSWDIGDLGRGAACTDPSGAAFRLWQPGSLEGAATVNAPGSWNFSELNTDDAAGAARFYGDVFGWEVSKVEMGASSTTMVRLPGYADFLEQFDPGIRQRHADFGAPPGFTECIAWILPLREGEAPHWSVTFAVANADEVATRAGELGGTVLVEPFDVAPVRSTVVADPNGARFAASAFNPG